MAIGMTYNKRQEDLNRQQGKIGSANPYTGMQGVNQNTANNLGNYQSGYTPSKTVQQAQQQMDAINAKRPQGYNSKYAPAMESRLQQSQSPEKCKYEFNGDEMFKYYADLYSQYAKQGAMDTMGNAAALTGGYGNTSAQNAAAQVYQQNMLPLYDRGMELQQQAYNRYRDALGDKQTAYNYLKDADTTAYGRYMDDMSQWLADRDYATGRYDTERGLDMNQWQNDRDYWTGLAQIENAAYNTEQERQEAIRQYEQNFAESKRQYDTSMAENQRQYDQNFAEGQRQYNLNFGEGQRQYDTSMAENRRQYDASMALNQRQFDQEMAEKKRQYDQNFARDYAVAILQNGQMPTMDLLMAAGLSEPDARSLMAQLQAAMGSGTGNGTGNGDGRQGIALTAKDAGNAMGGNMLGTGSIIGNVVNKAINTEVNPTGTVQNAMNKVLQSTTQPANTTGTGLLSSSGNKSGIGAAVTTAAKSASNKTSGSGLLGSATTAAKSTTGKMSTKEYEELLKKALKTATTKKSSNKMA